jgi:hypothetical protein
MTLCTPSPIAPHSWFQVLYFQVQCLLRCTRFSCVMAGEADQTLLVASDAAASDSQIAPGAVSNTAPGYSSSSVATQKIWKKSIPMLYNFWKMLTVTDAYLVAYHAAGWQPGGVISSSSELEFSMVDKTTIVCFESHLIVGLGLPISKFLVSILNFLKCELVHLSPNAITTLSCFIMICECWLRIPPNTSMFWYFYSPAQ